jgi:ATP-binding cassette subfamily B multidrug efflux pump
MTYAVVRDIRAKAIRQVQVLPLAYLDAHSSGDIVSRIIADADQLSDGLLLGFTQLFTGLITIIVATIGFMFSKNILITFLVILTTPRQFLCR